MNLLKKLDIKMKSLNENINIEYKEARIEFCYTSANILTNLFYACQNYVDDVALYHSHCTSELGDWGRVSNHGNDEEIEINKFK